jgi:membrane protein implicated in regulation of membrane protease activity
VFLLYIYVAAFIVGGIFLGASVFLGHHGGEGDAQADADGDHDAGGDGGDADHADAGAGGEGHELSAAGAEAAGASFSDFWLPFFSVRFWVFFLCFFGLTGSVFSLLYLAGKWATLGTSVAVGLVTGFAAAYVMQRLKRSPAGVVVPDASDFRGLEGVALLPIEATSKGKIRLERRGQLVDLVARVDSDVRIDKDDRVLVIEITDNEALVVPSRELASSEPRRLGGGEGGSGGAGS